MILLTLVIGILYPTFLPTPVWQDFSPLSPCRLLMDRLLWTTATASYRNSSANHHMSETETAQSETSPLLLFTCYLYKINRVWW